MTTCCRGLESRINSTHQKGISIKRTESSEAPFELYFSAVDKDKEIDFKEKIKNSVLDMPSVEA